MAQRSGRLMAGVEAIASFVTLGLFALYDYLLPKSLSTFAVASAILMIGETAAVALLVVDDARRAGRHIGATALILMAETALAAIVMIASVVYRPHISCYGLVLDATVLMWTLPFIAVELYLKS